MIDEMADCKVDLQVKWGLQVRLKCVFCRKFLKYLLVSDDDIRCMCGAAYEKVGDDYYIKERPNGPNQD